MRFLFLVILSGLVAGSPADFKSSQMNYPRVRAAFRDKEAMVNGMLSDRKIDPARMQIFIRVFKQEKLLQVWAGNRGEKLVHLINYDICASSGTLGPKRKVGDYQVPEGFYEINRFNPSSNFHLSLGINYPNRSDRILSPYGNPGGDIFIHGNCVTIGCIPITDDKIKELYVLAVMAKNNGQDHIPVHLFPTALSDDHFNALSKQYSADPSMVSFWENLKEGYDLFEKERIVPEVKVNDEGKYIYPLQP